MGQDNGLAQMVINRILVVSIVVNICEYISHCIISSGIILFL